MAFHVEVRRSFHRARLFNLEADDLRRRVLEPWTAGHELEAGERRWDPRESSLRVLEGPRLDATALAHGQGWNEAERSGREVTRELLGAGSATVVSPTRDGYDLGLALAAELGLAAVDWGQVRARLVAGDPAGVDTALVLVQADAGPWLFDAGLALGALRERAVLVAAGPDAPEQLAGIAVLPADASAIRRSRAPG
jgi:hypothetical protein